jgi:hypothetical protein
VLSRILRVFEVSLTKNVLLAAVEALRNGTLLMAYRGLEDRGMGMATSAAWDQPFSRLNGGVVLLGLTSPSWCVCTQLVRPCARYSHIDTTLPPKRYPIVSTFSKI